MLKVSGHTVSSGEDQPGLCRRRRQRKIYCIPFCLKHLDDECHIDECHIVVTKCRLADDMYDRYVMPVMHSKVPT